MIAMSPSLDDDANFTHSVTFDTSKWDEFGYDEPMKGPIFSTACNGMSIDWRLELFPNGAEVFTGCHRQNEVFIGLQQLSDSNDVSLKVLAFVQTKWGKQELVWENEYTGSKERGIYYLNDDEPLGTSLHHIKEKGYVWSGSLLQITVLLSIQKHSFEISDFPEDSEDMDHRDCPNSRLFDLLESNDPASYPDFTLYSEDKSGNFACHRAILACRSPEYFGGMFRCDMKEKAEGSAVLPFEAKIVREIIHFIYKDHVSSEFPSLPLTEVLKAACLVQLDKLAESCERELLSSFSIETAEQATEVLILAQKYNLKSLLNKAMNAAVATDSIDLIVKDLDPLLLVSLVKFQQALNRAPPFLYSFSKAVLGKEPEC